MSDNNTMITEVFEELTAEKEIYQAILDKWKSMMRDLICLSKSSKSKEERDFYHQSVIESLQCLLDPGEGDDLYDLVVGDYFGQGFRQRPYPVTVFELLNKMIQELDIMQL
ncbi:hypothetical protein PDESU_06274 [Pontiella desulfatans]|uniref:Uncharacterized protein n=1 Tax=Pontiella desulfatans TaxID=2750659 RepID=A0A6C2UBX4_PONDE|nr:hypothetical protein [Pontiella desulfatans]VGO17672.1 hypothetical protein PDESU_06274 [Pontiella desulfatans]